MRIPSASEVWDMLKQTFADWSEDKAPKLAAALALYTMLSIGPLLVIVLKVIGVVFGEQAAQGQVRQIMAGVVPPQAADFAQEAAKNAGQHGEGVLATVLSFGLLAFTATGVFGELQDSMNTIWEVKLKPTNGIWGYLRQRFLSFAMVLGLAFLFMVSTVGTTLITTLSGFVVGDNKAVAVVVATGASLVVMTALFAMIFKLLPDVKIAWRDVILGAVLTAVLFEVGKLLLGWYLSRGSTTSVYGAAGSLAVLLLYIYYSAQILFFGAEFTQVYARRYGGGIQPSANAEPMTEEARAQRGMGRPQPAATAPAASLAPAAAPAPTVVRNVPVVMPSTEQRKRQYVFGGSGLALGAAAGALAIFGLTAKRRATAKTAATVQLDQRLDNIERRLLRVNHAFDVVKRTPPPQRPSLRRALHNFVWRHPTLWPMAKGLHLEKVRG